MSLEVGDVVCIKSGGEPMTVISIDDDRVVCQKFDDFKKKDVRETYPITTLKKYDDHEEGKFFAS